MRLLKVARRIRDVQSIVHSIDGEPKGAMVLEGRNSFTPKPATRAWVELYEYGLVNTDSVDAVMTDDGYKLDNRTELGVRFLEFIAPAASRP